MEIARFVRYASSKLVSLFTSAMNRVRTSVFINHDCVRYVFISCIVAIIILTCYRRVQIACVFNKYMYFLSSLLVYLSLILVYKTT